MAASTFNTRLAAQTDLIRKSEFDAKLKGISDRVTKNKTKHLIVEDFAPASSKEFLDIQATIECGFTLKRVRDMIKTYS